MRFLVNIFIKKLGGELMPTINQLIRKGRQRNKKKSESPALSYNYNSIKGRQTKNESPQTRGGLFHQ